MAELTAFRIRVVVEGTSLGSWPRVGGLETTLDVIPYEPSRESLTTFLDRYLGRPQIGVQIEYTGTLDLRIVNWYRDAQRDPTLAKKPCVVELYDYDDKPVARYKLTNAWPKKITGFGFTTGRTADSNTVTIACEFMQRASV